VNEVGDFGGAFPTSWLVIFFVGSVVAYLVNRRHSGKRLDEFERECRSRGWTYLASEDKLADRWLGTPFGHGGDRSATSVVLGKAWGRRFTAFDYSYETSTGTGTDRQSTTHWFAICVIGLPRALPGLEVAPEGAFSWFTEAIGVTTDVDLESEDFNRAFRVSAGNKKFASDVLTPRTMEYLLVATPRAWRIEGNELVSWRSGTVEPDDVVTTVELLDGVVKAIPSFVWKDYALGPGYDPEP